MNIYDAIEEGYNGYDAGIKAQSIRSYFIIIKHSKRLKISQPEDYIFKSLLEVRVYLEEKEEYLHQINEFLYDSRVYQYSVKEMKLNHS